MRTIFTLLGLIFTFVVSSVSFIVFIAVEWYCTDYLTSVLTEMGVSSFWTNLIWGIMIVIVASELFIFVFNVIWRKIIGKFKEMFSLN